MDIGVRANAVISVEGWSNASETGLETASRIVRGEPRLAAAPVALDTDSVTGLEGAWASFLELSQNLGTARLAYCSIFKRWFDAAVAAVLLLLLSPLLLIAVLAVRLDSRGPVLFRQQRIGRFGRPFVVFKLRTMTTDPSAAPRWFIDTDGRVRHKIRNDPRITRAGRWLRRTSIDELPQLLNVVRGEMSLIGPRPELPEIVAAYRPWQHHRHLVRPGLTGWWQIQGRSDRPMHEHTELDLYYVDNLSFRFDLLILFRTIKVVLTGSGAY